MNTYVGLYGLVCLMLMHMVNIEAPVTTTCKCVTGDPQSTQTCATPAGFVCPFLCINCIYWVATLHPHPNNPDQFISCPPYCSGTPPTGTCLQCPNGLIFCPGKQKCDWPSNCPTTTIAPPTTAAPTVPPTTTTPPTTTIAPPTTPPQTTTT